MAKRTRNRLELRAEFDAAERRKEEEGKVKGEGAEEEEDEDEDEDEDDEEAEAGDESEDEEVAEDEDEEVEAKPKKKKKAVKEPKPRKSRVPKQVRQKAVWAVFNNSNQRVATFDYPKKQEALDHAVKLKGESKTNQTYFVQMVKEPIE
jgi:hypothetical protein